MKNENKMFYICKLNFFILVSHSLGIILPLWSKHIEHFKRLLIAFNRYCHKKKLSYQKWTNSFPSQWQYFFLLAVLWLKIEFLYFAWTEFEVRNAKRNGSFFSFQINDKAKSNFNERTNKKKILQFHLAKNFWLFSCFSFLYRASVHCFYFGINLPFLNWNIEMSLHASSGTC